MSEVLVGALTDLPEDEARGVTIGDRPLVLCRVDEIACALSGICTHEDRPLDGGAVERGVLTCPWHGARYDIATGRVLALPAVRPLKTYRTRVDATGKVYVALDD